MLVDRGAVARSRLLAPAVDLFQPGSHPPAERVEQSTLPCYLEKRVVNMR